jgi:hypothetical protein
MGMLHGTMQVGPHGVCVCARMDLELHVLWALRMHDRACSSRSSHVGEHCAINNGTRGRREEGARLVEGC